MKGKTFVFLYFMCKRSSSSDHDASFLLTEDGRTAGQASKPQTSTSGSCPLRKTERKERERARERGKRERTSVRRSEGSGWKQSMDAVRIEGTARFSLTRKRKISKLSRRIETRRQVGTFFRTFELVYTLSVSVLSVWKGNSLWATVRCVWRVCSCACVCVFISRPADSEVENSVRVMNMERREIGEGGVICCVSHQFFSC